MENTVNFTRKDQEIIASAIISMCDNSGLSAAKFSRTIDIDKADISNLRNKKWLEKPQLIGSAKWIKFARIAKFTNRQEAKWVVAPTQMYDYVTSQLAIC